MSELPGQYPDAISREDLAELPIRRYEGPVRVVDTAETLALAMEDLRREQVLGFDTETRPAFRKGESHLPCLVQLASAQAVYLFQILKLDCSAVLGELLAAPGIIKAGVAPAHDLRQLKQRFPFEPAGVLDLGALAKRHGTGQTGLRNLAGLFLGFRIPKGTRTSNWAAPRLSPAQVTYAATDAWACRELYLHFQSLGWRETRAG